MAGFAHESRFIAKIRKQEILELSGSIKIQVSKKDIRFYGIYKFAKNQEGELKIGRNQPCPCGSGLKYKKCCALSLPRQSFSERNTEGNTEKNLPAPKKQPRKQESITVEMLSLLRAEELSQIMGKNYSAFQKYKKENEDKRFKFSISNWLSPNEDEGGIHFQATEIGVSNFYFEIDLDVFECFIGKDGDIRVSSKIAPDEAHISVCLLHRFLRSPGNVSDPQIKTLRSLFDSSYKKTVTLDRVVLAHPDSRVKKTSDETAYSVLGKNFKYDFLFCPGNDMFLKSFLSDASFGQDIRYLYFCFSDGSAIDGRSLLFHPYNMLISDLSLDLQTILSKGGNKYDSAWVKENYTGYRHFINRKYLLEFLEKITPIYPVYLAEIRDDKITYSKETLIKKAFLEPRKEKIEFKEIGPNEPDGIISLEIIDESDDQNLGFKIESSFYNSQDKTLAISPEKTMADHLEKILKPFNPVIHVDAEKSNVKKNDSTLFLLKNHPDINDVKKKLKKNKIAADFSKLPEIQPVESCFDINIEKAQSNKAQLTVSYEKGNFSYCLKDSSNELQLIRSSLSTGICGLFYKDARNIASRDTLYRANEIKLYKHTGLIKLALLECIQFVKLNSNTSEKGNQSEREFIKSLMDKLATFCFILVTKETPEENFQMADLESCLISKTFITRLKKYLKTVLGLFSKNTTLIADGHIYELNIGPSMVKIFDFILMAELGLAPNHKVFYRGKGAETYVFLRHDEEKFEKTPISSSKETQSLADVINNKNIPIAAVSSIGRVSIDGCPIESLTSEDISSELNIQSSESSIDWFELHPKYFFRGTEVDPHLARQFLKGEVVEYQGRFFRIDPSYLPSIKALNRFWDRLQTIKNPSDSRFYENSLNVKMERSQILELLALKRKGIPVLGDDKWKEISRAFENLDNLQETYRDEVTRAMKSFNGKLKPFQLDGLLWLYNIYKLGLGGLLSDDMGLGKTVQSISFLHSLMEQGELKWNLIVVPTSLVYNWKTEFKKFSPSIKVEAFESSMKETLSQSYVNDEPRVVVCTYGLFTEHIEFFKKFKWQTVFFDEAQNLKNLKAKRREASYMLKASNKFALTGTPLENHFGELFSIMDICLPGALGPYKDFMQTFDIKHISEDRMGISRDDISFLKEKIRPLVLRRTKSVVLKELPKKTETVMPILFDKKQEDVYKKIALSWNKQIQETIDEKGEAGAQLQMLTALLRLRQACSCPHAIPGTNESIVSPKIPLIEEKLLELVENGESSIVFTNFLSTLDFLKKRLEDRGIEVLSICGKDSKPLREKTLKAFNNPDKSQVLIMTLKTGGVGLNLTKANYVFHLEPWWNPAAENQGTDRVHRMGQNRSVHVYRYIIKNSVEEKIPTFENNASKMPLTLFFQKILMTPLMM